MKRLAFGKRAESSDKTSRTPSIKGNPDDDGDDIGGDVGDDGDVGDWRWWQRKASVASLMLVKSPSQ